MPDSPIDGDGVTIQQLFNGKTFRLDHYQREYCWSRESVQLLLDDLQRRFLASWRPTDDMQATTRYAPYFLGPFVYHENDGVTYLVDGQQRITTLHLILIYLHLLLKHQELYAEAAQVQTLVYRRHHGKSSFTIDIPERHNLLMAFLHEEDYPLPANCSSSLRTLHDRSREIGELFPEELRGDALPYFHEWLLDRVCLVGIKALSKDNAWEIFESMNDRGVRLGPVDLLKSHLLSKVDPIDQKRLDKTWRGMHSQLSALDSNAVSEFIKTVLAAKFAVDVSQFNDLRGGSTPFHEWVRMNEDRLSLKSSTDFSDFIELLAKLAGYYATLYQASRSFELPEPRLHALFYNQYNHLGIQLPLIFAAVTSADQAGDVKDKAALIASFVDLLHVRYLVNNAVSVTDIEAHLAQLALRLRDCTSLPEIAEILGSEVDLMRYDLGGIDKLSYHQNTRQIRYILARLTCYVEVGCDGQNMMAEYLNEQVPYEVEHIIPENNHSQKAMQSFGRERNRLGALVILPKSVNASLRDAPYEKKVEQYRQQNKLAASLHKESYASRGNPGFVKFRRTSGLTRSFRSFPAFGLTAIDSRQGLYRQLCELIWNPASLGIPASAHPRTASAPSQPRARSKIELSDLIEIGLIEAGEPIFGSAGRFTATIRADGSITVDSGETFGSLSAAGRFVRESKSSGGWDFWRVRRNDVLVPLAKIRAEALERGILEAPLRELK